MYIYIYIYFYCSIEHTNRIVHDGNDASNHHVKNVAINLFGQAPRVSKKSSGMRATRIEWVRVGGLMARDVGGGGRLIGGWVCMGCLLGVGWGWVGWTGKC